MNDDGELPFDFGLPNLSQELKDINKALDNLQDQKSWKSVEEFVQSTVIQFATDEGFSGELTVDKIRAHRFSDVRRAVLKDLVELLTHLRENIFPHNDFKAFTRFLHFKNNHTLTAV